MLRDGEKKKRKEHRKPQKKRKLQDAHQTGDSAGDQGISVIRSLQGLLSSEGVRFHTSSYSQHRSPGRAYCPSKHRAQHPASLNKCSVHSTINKGGVQV